MNTLEKIAQIDWSSMGSPNIPNWMNELMSEDAQKRFHAYDEMVNHHLAPPECLTCSCGAADLFALVKRDTAFYLIPFLIEFLDDTNVKDDTKYFILNLLNELLRYNGAEICLVEAEREDYRPFARRIYNRVNEGIHLYQQLANSRSLKISSSAESVLHYLQVFK